MNLMIWFLEKNKKLFIQHRWMKMMKVAQLQQEKQMMTLWPWKEAQISMWLILKKMMAKLISKLVHQLREIERWNNLGRFNTFILHKPNTCLIGMLKSQLTLKSTINLCKSITYSNNGFELKQEVSFALIKK